MFYNEKKKKKDLLTRPRWLPQRISLLLALTLAIAVQVYAKKPGTWHDRQEVVFKSRSSTGLKASKPHIIMMLVDDWGRANVGYHRNASDRETVTPNFDKLLKEGLELNQNYAFQACTPSRSSFLTGRLPIHVNDKLGSFDYQSISMTNLAHSRNLTPRTLCQVIKVFLET